MANFTDNLTHSSRPEESKTEEFVQLLLEARDRLHAFILILVPHWPDAEELLQKTSIILWRKFDDFDPSMNFLAWARGIARLEVKNFRRVKGRERITFSDELVTSLADVQESIKDEFELRQQSLTECIKQLSPGDEKLITELYGSQRVTAKQVAQVLGRPVNTVYKALERIHKQLFECVRRRMAVQE